MNLLYIAFVVAGVIAAISIAAVILGWIESRKGDRFNGPREPL